MANDISLDSDGIYARLDSAGIGGRIASLPDQIEEAHGAAWALDLPANYAEARQIAVLGMGGSAIGGLLLQALAVDAGAKVPVMVVRDYRLPAYVGAGSLVIASSNSGNTEETVAAFRQALASGARCLAVTTGGRLVDLAREHDVPALTFRWDGEPRSALGWSFATLLAIVSRLLLLPEGTVGIAPAVDDMRAQSKAIARDVPEASNPAKQLARRLHGRLPAFAGSGLLAPVAYRWRTQVNENAKSWAIADELPEMNHNAQAGYGLPADVVPRLYAVLLRHAGVHPRVAARFDATLDEMRRNGVAGEIVDVDGRGSLAQMLRAVHLGDYVSYYLGLLNGVEPSPVEPLERLKARMASLPPEISQIRGG